MTGRHRSLRAIALFIPAMVLILAIAAAEVILRHPAGEVAVTVALPAAAFAAGRLTASRWASRPRFPASQQPPSGMPAGQQPRIAADRAELAELRRQVADLEDAAGRPIGAVTASYRHIQSRYQNERPAMTWADHDHGGEYAAAGHNHDRYDVYGVAEEHHRHYDTESELRGLREDLNRALEHIAELAAQLRGVAGRCPAAEPEPEEPW